MTPEELEAIRERAEKATEGLWSAEPHAHLEPGCRCMSCHADPVGWSLVTPTASYCDDRGGTCDRGPLLSFEDADFAARARTDVPALLAEVERLQHELKPARDVLEAARAWRVQFYKTPQAPRMEAYNRVARAHNKRVYRLQKLFYEEAFQQEWTELHDYQD